jgi:hypothetical protein
MRVVPPAPQPRGVHPAERVDPHSGRAAAANPYSCGVPSTVLRRCIRACVGPCSLHQRWVEQARDGSEASNSIRIGRKMALSAAACRTNPGGAA